MKTEVRANINKQHPDYKNIAAVAQVIKDCFECGDKLLSSTYIKRHMFESKGAYKSRLARSYAFPTMSKPINQFLSVIFRTDIVREGAALANLSPFFNDATGYEVPFTPYMFALASMAMVFGKAYSVVDFSVNESDAGRDLTLADLDGGAIFPTTTIYTPLDLVNWSYIPRKGFEACVFKRTRVIDGKNTNTLLYVDSDTFEETDAQGGKIEGGGPFPHSLGYTPVFTLNYTGSIYAASSIGDMLKSTQKGSANLLSIVDEMSERQAFSQLCVPDDGTISELEHKQTDVNNNLRKIGEISPGVETSAKDNVLNMLSDSAALTYPAGTGHPPQFISPNATELKNIWKYAKELILQGYISTGLTDARGNVSLESAAPLMRVFAHSLAAHEARILKTVAKYLSGNVDDIVAYYPQIPDALNSDWIDICNKLAEATWLSDEAKIGTIKSIVSANINQVSTLGAVAIMDGVIAPTQQKGKENEKTQQARPVDPGASQNTSNTPQV